MTARANLEAEVSFEGDATVVTLRGTIDENAPAVLEQAFRGVDGQVRINLREVRKINSCGIEELMKVLHDVSREHRVEYSECPEVVVDQFQMMDFSMYGRISSFFIRYLCESCGEEKTVLLNVKQDLRIDAEHREIQAPTQACGCGGTMQIDDYLDFLDDHIDW